MHVLGCHYHWISFSIFWTLVICSMRRNVKAVFTTFFTLKNPDTYHLQHSASMGMHPGSVPTLHSYYDSSKYIYIWNCLPIAGGSCCSKWCHAHAQLATIFIHIDVLHFLLMSLTHFDIKMTKMKWKYMSNLNMGILIGNSLSTFTLLSL